MKFNYLKSQVYLRDRLVSFDQANLSIASSPVLYGLSIYSVFSATWDDKSNKLRIFRLPDHYERLIQSAKIMDLTEFEQTWSYARFAQTVRQLLTQNNIKQDVLIRATVFIDEIAAGTKMHGLKNSLSIYVYPFEEIMPSSGVNVCVSSWQRNSDKALPPRLKANGSYVNASLMKNEALINGYDDAIALNVAGHVSEGTVANIFLVSAGQLITPDTSSDILIGITRDSIFKLADHLKIPYVERAVDYSELYLADEVLFCGSSANVTPILSIDKRPVGKAQPGPITKQLAQAYDSARRGKNSNFTEWLTEIKV